MPYKNIEDQRRQRREYAKIWNKTEKGKLAYEKEKIAKKERYRLNPEKYRAMGRKTYAAHREKYIQASVAITKIKRQKLYDFKKNLECDICGENNSFCLDFHHIDPGTKDLTIGKVAHYSWNRLMSEVEKCIVVCANCHRKIHHGMNLKDIITEFFVNDSAL